MTAFARRFAIIISVVLALGMFPGVALAAGSGLSAGNELSLHASSSNNADEDAYKLYYEKIQQLIKVYGSPEVVKAPKYGYYIRGLAVARVVDFGDGAERLLVCYYDKSKDTDASLPGSMLDCYPVEVWSYNSISDSLAKDYSGKAQLEGQNYYCSSVKLRTSSGKKYILEPGGSLASENTVVTSYYYGIANDGKFGDVLNVGMERHRGSGTTTWEYYYYVNGTRTSESERDKAVAAVLGDTEIIYVNSLNLSNRDLNITVDATKASIAQLQSQSDDYSATAAKLLANTNRSTSPLSEYNDPQKYTEKYRKSVSGWIQTFISQYGKLKTDKEVWTASYESALIDILNDDNTVKEVSRLGKYDKWLQKGFSAVAGEIESAAKVKKVLSQEGKLLSIMLSALTDTQKLSIKKDYVKIELLDGVRKNTSDALLKKACENCMGAYYSNTINTVKGIAIDALPKVLVKGAAAADLATAPVISKALSVGGLATTSAVLTGASEALGYVGIILLAKDVASWLTGMDARTDAYLKTACLEAIYQSGRNAYNNIIGEAPNSYHASWFNFLLQVKQKQYASMAKIYTSGTWSKELKSDGFLANRCKLIKGVTASNYSKSVSASTVEVVGATYTGKAIKPAVTVKMGDTKLASGKDYVVSYSNNVKAGQGSVSVKAKGNYKGTVKSSFQIKQAKNTARATKTSVKTTIKASVLAKKAKAVKLPLVKSLFGKAKWSVAKKDKKKVLSLSGSKVKVKKGAKKGTYTIKLKASVAKTKNYKAATTKVVTVKVTVK